MSAKSTPAEYVRNNYDRIMLNVKKGEKINLQKIAGKKGISLNEYIKKALARQYLADTNEEIDL